MAGGWEAASLCSQRKITPLAFQSEIFQFPILKCSLQPIKYDGVIRVEHLLP